MNVRTLKDLARLVDSDERSDDDETQLPRRQNTMSRYTNEETGKPADEVVVMRARALCFKRNQDPNKFEHINAATIEVLKADKVLAKDYKELKEEVE